MSADAAIEIQDVVCTFGSVRALDGVSARVMGAVVAVVGPNGAGKTTLIDVVCGLVRPKSGVVRVMGQDVSRAASSIRARIGILPQETALYDEVTLLQNLRFAAALYDVARPETRIGEVLDVVGLAPRAHDPVRTLSGGMQRRAAIARALLHDPPLLILDEPTVGVDVEARHQIWAHIRQLRTHGRTVLLTTNYLDEAEALCDTVIILRAGKVVAEDSPATLIARAGHCLEIEYSGALGPNVSAALSQRDGVLRVEISEGFIRLYLGANTTPEDVVHSVRALCEVRSFRTRSPDLVELFRALTGERKSP